MKKDLSFVQFTREFDTEEKWFAYLVDLKWGNGYCCRRCNHTAWVKGRKWHHRRCQSCNYDESCTANTLFHKLKFSVVKAFWIIQQLSTMKKACRPWE